MDDSVIGLAAYVPARRSKYPMYSIACRQHWRYLQAVELWQAVALSLDVEPSDIGHVRDEADTHIDPFAVEFRARLRLAETALRPGNGLGAALVQDDSEDPVRSIVNLEKFVEWFHGTGIEPNGLDMALRLKNDDGETKGINPRADFTAAVRREENSECTMGQFFTPWTAYCDIQDQCPYEGFRRLMEWGVTLKAGSAGTVAEDARFDPADVRYKILYAKKTGDTGLSRTTVDVPDYTELPLAEFRLSKDNLLSVLSQRDIHDFVWPEHGFPELSASSKHSNQGDDMLRERRKAIAQIKAYRTLAPDADSYEADCLLDKPIMDSLAKLNSLYEFDKCFYLYTWKNTLNTDKKRVKAASYENEADREKRLAKIYDRIEEINRHLDGSQLYESLQPKPSSEPVSRGDGHPNLVLETPPQAELDPKVLGGSVNRGYAEKPIESKPKCKGGKRGPTRINRFLREKWDLLGKPKPEAFVKGLKRFVYESNSPVKKYYGWHDQVCIEWHPGCGSPQGSWGKKAFQNKVDSFKRQDAADSSK
jgi:hypothetical protein